MKNSKQVNAKLFPFQITEKQVKNATNNPIIECRQGVEAEGAYEEYPNKSVRVVKFNYDVHHASNCL